MRKDKNRAELFSIHALFGFWLPTIVFTYLASHVYQKLPIPGDRILLEHIHTLTSPAFTRICIYLTDLGSASVVIIAVLIAVTDLALKHRLRQALFLLVAAAGTAAINVFAKTIFLRARPELWHHLVVETDYSFPSGHAMITSAMSLAVILLLWRTKYRLPAVAIGIIYTLSVGFSRLYLGVHYPSDILGGWCVSTIWITALHYGFTRLQTYKKVPKN